MLEKNGNVDIREDEENQLLASHDLLKKIAFEVPLFNPNSR